MYKIANEAAPDIRIIRKELSERLAEVVALSLAKQPELRYQDGDRFAADLRAVIASLEGSAPVASYVAPSAAPAAQFDATVVQSASGAQTPEPKAYDATQVMKADEAQTFEKTVVSKPPVADTDTQ
jgi:serine/threonine-protein kinase